MKTGSLPLSSVPGPVDLQATLESGQTFYWTRDDGGMYDSSAPSGGSAWYRTVMDEHVVEVRQTADALEWRSEFDPTDHIRTRLRLDEEMATMLDALPDEPLIEDATRFFWGLRVVDEPFFPTLVSFILSAQMRVERIHSLVQSLRREFGPALPFGEETVYGFPSPSRLAAVPESELRDLGLGYRAPYVKRSAGLIADDELTAGDIDGLPYEDARNETTGFVGVGQKVADCVLLFSLGYTEPVPLDTWIDGAIDEHFPSVDATGYDDRSEAIREILTPYPGIAQTYLFHFLRHRTALLPDSGKSRR